jgi:biotin carboxyl carrier protein
MRFNMKKRLKYVVMIAFVVIIVAFIITSVQRASRRERAASPPELNETSMVLYGTLEPLGKAVSVSPKVNGIVKEIHVQEGDAVQAGQPLCTIENISREVRLSLLPVTAPQDGIVYKCDLRIGEAFNVGDVDPLVLGSANLQICCDVEILWIGRIDKYSTYEVFNAENEGQIGTARFRSASRYLRPKSVRTEEPGEKASTQYQEVIMNFMPNRPDSPIGLPVMLRLKEGVD